MRTVIEWRTYDTESIDSSIKCNLAINHKNGRLQWFPGSEYYKFAALIPFMMALVILIFFLLTRFDTVNNNNHHKSVNLNQNKIISDLNIFNDYNYNNNNDFDDDTVTNNMQNKLLQKNNNNDNDNDDDDNDNIDEKLLFSTTRQHGTSSDFMDYERENIFRDFRTSCIPSDSVLIPESESVQNVNNKDNEELYRPEEIIYSNNAYKSRDDSVGGGGGGGGVGGGAAILRSRRKSTKIQNCNDDNSNTCENNNNNNVNELLISTNSNSSENLLQNQNQNKNENTLDVGKEDVVEKRDNDDDDDENNKSNLNTNVISIGFNFLWRNREPMDTVRKAQAEIMKKYMDSNTDPCDDFYQYACGNWEKLNPMPKDKAGYDTFEILRESLDNVLKDLLTSKSNERRSILSHKKFMHTSSKDNNNDNEFENRPLTSIRLRKKIIKKRDVLLKMLKRYQLYKYMKRKRRYLNKLQIFKRNKKYERSTEIDAETKAKYLYRSCMNEELLEKRGIQPLLQLLDSLGGWPILNSNWNENEFDWLSLIAHLRRYNNDVLIVEWVGADIKNSDENIIQFDQTSLGLPTREYYLHESNSKYLNAYKFFMENVMNLLGATKQTSQNAAKDVIDFETELARITSSSEDRSNISMLYKKMSIEELHNEVPGIDWKKYLSIVQQRNVDTSEMIVIYAIDYMKKLVTLVDNTKRSTISNYVLWRFIRHRINNLDDRFKETKQMFFQTLFGREKSPQRWKNCVAQVNSNMGMAVGAMFVRKYFDENSKEDTLQMTHELQDAFKNIVEKTDWLDVNTKRLAELKVSSMSLKIGYPDFILNHNKLNHKYDGLHIDPDKYFENTLNVLRFVTDTEQLKLGKVVNKTIWDTAPAIVNAYYSRNKNQIMFPAGILQPPFYHRYFPKSLNYGGIGVVIGHELTHGFDDKGRLFDSNGNIMKWWSDSAISSFHERAKCLVSQYGNYTVSEVGISVDGESTQGENIADNGGIRQAFEAYENWLKRNENLNLDDETLPGLNMTNKQLFFLNFAQIWCGVMRPEATKNKLKTAVHSPGKFRVIGTLSNSKEFAREFNCPIDSPMNPSKKCSVW